MLSYVKLSSATMRAQPCLAALSDLLLFLPPSFCHLAVFVLLNLSSALTTDSQDVTLQLIQLLIKSKMVFFASTWSWTHNKNVFYFHVNVSIGIVQKIDFEIRPDSGCTTLKTPRKVVLDNPSVCLSVCPSVRPSVCLSDRLSCCRFSRKLLTDRVETLGVCSVT